MDTIPTTNRNFTQITHNPASNYPKPSNFYDAKCHNPDPNHSKKIVVYQNFLSMTFSSVSVSAENISMCQFLATGVAYYLPTIPYYPILSHAIP